MMDDFEFKREWVLTQHRMRCECYVENIKSIHVMANNAIKLSLFLNGMGAVAILYSPQVALWQLYPTLLLLACGAFSAVVSGCFLYISNELTARILKSSLFMPPNPDREVKDALYGQERAIVRKSGIFHTCWVICLLFSYAFFIIGAIKGYCKLAL